MEVERFKMKVTPKQSEIVQKRLFELGYCWLSGDKIVCNLQANYLYFGGFDGILALEYSYDYENSFIKSSLDELTFEQFKNKYMKEEFKLPEKWCVKSDDEVEHVIIRGWFYRNQSIKGFFSFMFPVGTYYISDNLEYSDSWVYQYKSKHPDYTEITYDEFIKYVVNKEQNMELTVTKEKVLEAAKTSDGAKEALKVLFPEVFKPEYFDFGDSTKLDFNFNTPLAIANRFIKTEDDKRKVLLVHNDYEVEVIPDYYPSFTGLKFKKKN